MQGPCLGCHSLEQNCTLILGHEPPVELTDTTPSDSWHPVKHAPFRDARHCRNTGGSQRHRTLPAFANRGFIVGGTLLASRRLRIDVASTRPPECPHRGYTENFWILAVYVRHFWGRLCPSGGRVGQNLTQNVLQVGIWCQKIAKNREKIAKIPEKYK